MLLLALIIDWAVLQTALSCMCVIVILTCSISLELFFSSVVNFFYTLLSVQSVLWALA